MVGVIVRTLISFNWFVLSYLNNSPREFTLPYCYFFTILWCRCGPGYFLRGWIIGYGFRGKVPASVTITQFLFLLVNHFILWRISMTVRLMTWKQGLVYEWVWMWFQWSMENFIRHSTLRCGSFSLFLGFPSSGIMCCGILLLYWCGLVFGPNWGFIECPQNQSDGLVKVLDVYGNHSW